MNLYITINDFIQVSNDAYDKLTKVLTVHQVNNLIEQSKTIAGYYCPDPIDYCTYDNPYKERYGEQDWYNKIIQSTFMKQYVCINNLVEHIMVRQEMCSRAQHTRTTSIFTMTP